MSSIKPLGYPRRFDSVCRYSGDIISSCTIIFLLSPEKKYNSTVSQNKKLSIILFLFLKI